ncbi:lipocalin family protein [Salinicola halophilus]|uniref:lipocalin family protein n=1 Tax=Salinicola halophilus TaxID=184065 RepID=UPI000DA14974|nr:lipocalin family protein [Salinicola halophilus]
MLLPTRLPRYPRLTWLAPFTFLAGCTGVPEGTQPVGDFRLDHYLGQWYEIARLDHGFEEGLECVRADYSRREDGGIRVINSGFDPETQAWEQAEGRASFVGDDDVGHLKVSFFGPFYAGYNVLELDDDYRHALVAGPDRDYLWILSRTPTLAPATYQSLVERARELDFPVDELIRVEQRPSHCSFPADTDTPDAVGTP